MARIFIVNEIITKKTGFRVEGKPRRTRIVGSIEESGYAVSFVLKGDEAEEICTEAGEGWFTVNISRQVS